MGGLHRNPLTIGATHLLWDVSSYDLIKGLFVSPPHPHATVQCLLCLFATDRSAELRCMQCSTVQLQYCLRH